MKRIVPSVLTLVLIAVMTACTSATTVSDTEETPSYAETVETFPELETTTTTENPAIKAQQIAYESCKVWRQTQFDMLNNLVAAYPYSDNARHALIAYGGASNAKDTMQRAASIDSSYMIYVSSLEKWLPYLFKDFQESKSGRSSSYNSNEPSGTKFHDLCAKFGIYPSTPGMYPPINYVAREPQPTPLNGARKVCHDVFFISPDQVVFYGKQAFTLDECDRLAQEVAAYSDSFQSAKDEMMNRVFGRYDQWCWYQECKSRWDVM
jgi:hypothetical protein